MNQDGSDQVKGCILGAICADSLLAGYEGGIMERLLWKIIGRTPDGKYRYTDDTVMILNLVDEYLENGQVFQEQLAKRFAESYRWSRGYGPDAGRILQGIKQGKDWKILNKKRFKEGSYGNGAAMRCTPVALISYFKKVPLKPLVHKVSEITHCHPIAIDSALLVSNVIYAILSGKPMKESIFDASKDFKTDEFNEVGKKLCQFVESPSSVKDLKQVFGSGVVALQSVPSAIALSYLVSDGKFADLIDACRVLGGDTDTIGSIAGSIWGCKNGSDQLSTDYISEIENGDSIVKKVNMFGKVLCN